MAEWVIVGFDNPDDTGCALTEPTRLQGGYLSNLEGDVIAMRRRSDWDRLRARPEAGSTTALTERCNDQA
jgi:hypothetical protein